MINDAKRGKRTLMSFANSEGSDQHAHPCSLNWAFSVCRHILQFVLIL